MFNSPLGNSAPGESRSVFKDIDWFTVILYLVLVIAGAFSIYAASYKFDDASIWDFSQFSGKQLRWIGLSLVLGLFLILVDVRFYENYAYVIYIAMVLLLIVTIAIAPDIKGSRSWLVLGPMSLQPAEFGKFATALALAKLFSSYNFHLNASRNNYLKALAIILLPFVLIILQKETGSALVYLSLFFVLYREGMSGLVLLAGACAVTFFVVALKYSGTETLGITTGRVVVYSMIMAIMVLMLALYARCPREARNLFLVYAGTGVLVMTLALCGVPVPGNIYFLCAIVGGVIYCLYIMLHGFSSRVLITAMAAVLSLGFLLSIDYVFNKSLKSYQKERIMVTLGIMDDPKGMGYNVNQSKIAIGSGGLAGKGFLNGTQTKLKYVPEQHTDFIFCTIGEEEGFIGSTVVLALFLILILRIISIAERQPGIFGRVYAYCVASYFIMHLAINIGMVIGRCPVIGIPLPFFSYGGSSLWGFTFLLFILLRIDAARRERPSY